MSFSKADSPPTADSPPSTVFILRTGASGGAGGVALSQGSEAALSSQRRSCSPHLEITSRSSAFCCNISPQKRFDCSTVASDPLRSGHGLR